VQTLLNLKCFRVFSFKGLEVKAKMPITSLLKKNHTDQLFSYFVQRKQVLYKNSSVTLRSADLRCIHCVCSNVTKLIV